MSMSSVRRSIAGIAGLLLVALAAAACSTAASPTSAPATNAPAASSPASTGVVVSMATTSIGTVLTGPNGRTLYTHAGDSATSSTCTGGCATAWPPLSVPAGTTATAGAGVTGTLGTLTRADGTIQVTYNGLPLYGWQSDTKPGDTTGDGINGFSAAKP